MRAVCFSLLLFAFGVVGLSPIAWAQSAGSPADDDRISRLEILADLWGKLWLFHPTIVTTDIDWDQVLVDTIPTVESATSSDALIEVLNSELLAPLGDPALVAYRTVVPEPPERRPLSARRISADVGYIDAGNPLEHGRPDFAQRFAELVKGLGTVETLVLDLRCRYVAERHRLQSWKPVAAAGAAEAD